MTDTIRDRIMEQLKAIFEGMEKGLPTNDPYQVEWSEVTREDVKQLKTGKEYALGIYEGTETTTSLNYPFTDCLLELFFEFHVYIDKGEKPAKKLNMVLGEIIRKLNEDTSIGSLALDIIEDGNDFDIEGTYDKQCSGVLNATLKYRRRTDDPRLAA